MGGSEIGNKANRWLFPYYVNSPVHQMNHKCLVARTRFRQVPGSLPGSAGAGSTSGGPRCKPTVNCDAANIALFFYHAHPARPVKSFPTGHHRPENLILFPCPLV